MTVIVGGLLYFTGIKNSKAYYYGPPLGATNSPYDGASCAYPGCHSSHPLQSPKPWINSNVPVAGYSPDSIYTFTAKAVYIGKSSFGFEISPQTVSGSPLGTLIVSNATTTQIGTFNSLQYIEQTANGYQGTDSLAWTFKWKAPVAGTGSVTFYGCFNCGQGNSSAANTYVYPATLTIPENVNAGINNLVNESISFSVFPNPAKEQINISYNLKETLAVQINIYAVDGRKIGALLNSMMNKGEQTQAFSLPSGIKPGIYLLQLIANNKSTVQRIVVQ